MCGFISTDRPPHYHRCPACGEVYATEADWLACPWPSNGSELQDDFAGGHLRLRLCRSCSTSMARPVRDDAAEVMAAAYVALEERCAELSKMLTAQTKRADTAQERIRGAYAHIGTATAMLIDTDEPALAEHIRAAAKVLMGGGV